MSVTRSVWSTLAGSVRAHARCAAIVISFGSMAPNASAQFEMDPYGLIEGELVGEGLGTASDLMQALTAALGFLPTTALMPLGSPEPYLGPCPSEPILDSEDYPAEFEISVSADVATGQGEVSFDLTFCMIVSESPCQVQCFELRLLWEPVPPSLIFALFIKDPPPPEPSGPGGYSFQFVRTGECLDIQIVVTPWGQVMSGEAFAAQYPELIAGVIAGLAGRLTQTFDPSCVTWTKS